LAQKSGSSPTGLTATGKRSSDWSLYWRKEDENSWRSNRAQALSFRNALDAHQALLVNPRPREAGSSLTSMGWTRFSDEIFNRLISLPTTDFMFFFRPRRCIVPRPSGDKRRLRDRNSYDVHRQPSIIFKTVLPADQVFSWAIFHKKAQ